MVFPFWISSLLFNSRHMKYLVPADIWLLSRVIVNMTFVFCVYCKSNCEALADYTAHQYKLLRKKKSDRFQ